MAPSTSLDQHLGIWDSFICPTPSAFLPTELNPTIHETSATPWAWRLACSHLKATVEGAMNGDDMPQHIEKGPYAKVLLGRVMNNVLEIFGL